MKSIMLIVLITLLAVGQSCNNYDCMSASYNETTTRRFNLTANGSLPIQNAVATCNYANPCGYNVPSGWMLQFTMASSSRFSFTIQSNGPFYADYGPDTHHYFSGSCCSFGEKGNAATCAGNFQSIVRYSGTCSTSCPTIIAVWNTNTYPINVQVYIYGASGPM